MLTDPVLRLVILGDRAVPSTPGILISRILLPLLLWLAVVSLAGAETSVTRIKKNATSDALFSFEIKVQRVKHQGKHDAHRVQVTITPNPKVNHIPAAQRAGKLEIYRGAEFVSSSEPEPVGTGKGLTFTFLVSPKYLEKTKFTFSETPPRENVSGEGFFYWFYIQDFVEANKKAKPAEGGQRD